MTRLLEHPLVPEGRLRRYVCTPRDHSIVPPGRTDARTIASQLKCWAIIDRPSGAKLLSKRRLSMTRYTSALPKLSPRPLLGAFLIPPALPVVTDFVTNLDPPPVGPGVWWKRVWIAISPRRGAR